MTTQQTSGNSISEKNIVDSPVQEPQKTAKTRDNRRNQKFTDALHKGEIDRAFAIARECELITTLDMFRNKKMLQSDTLINRHVREELSRMIDKMLKENPELEKCLPQFKCNQDAAVVAQTNSTSATLNQFASNATMIHADPHLEEPHPTIISNNNLFARSNNGLSSLSVPQPYHPNMHQQYALHHMQGNNTTTNVLSTSANGVFPIGFTAALEGHGANSNKYFGVDDNYYQLSSSNSYHPNSNDVPHHYNFNNHNSIQSHLYNNHNMSSVNYYHHHHPHTTTAAVGRGSSLASFNMNPAANNVINHSSSVKNNMIGENITNHLERSMAPGRASLHDPVSNVISPSHHQSAPLNQNRASNSTRNTPMNGHVSNGASTSSGRHYVNTFNGAQSNGGGHITGALSPTSHSLLSFNFSWPSANVSLFHNTHESSMELNCNNPLKNEIISSSVNGAAPSSNHHYNLVTSARSMFATTQPYHNMNQELHSHFSRSINNVNSKNQQNINFSPSTPIIPASGSAHSADTTPTPHGSIDPLTPTSNRSTVNNQDHQKKKLDLHVITSSKFEPEDSVLTPPPLLENVDLKSSTFDCEHESTNISVCKGLVSLPPGSIPTRQNKASNNQQEGVVVFVTSQKQRSGTELDKQQESSSSQNRQNAQSLTLPLMSCVLGTHSNSGSQSHTYQRQHHLQQPTPSSVITALPTSSPFSASSPTASLHPSKNPFKSPYHPPDSVHTTRNAHLSMGIGNHAGTQESNVSASPTVRAPSSPANHTKMSAHQTPYMSHPPYPLSPADEAAGRTVVAAVDLTDESHGIQAVKEYLQGAPHRSVNDVVSKKLNQSLLHLACAKGHDKLVKFLLENGAFVNARNKDGLTPLHRAAENGRVNAAIMLLDAGADPIAAAYPVNSSVNVGTASNKHGVTPSSILQGEKTPHLQHGGASTPLDFSLKSRSATHEEISRIISYRIADAFGFGGLLKREREAAKRAEQSLARVTEEVLRLRQVIREKIQDLALVEEMITPPHEIPIYIPPSWAVTSSVANGVAATQSSPTKQLSSSVIARAAACASVPCTLPADSSINLTCSPPRLQTSNDALQTVSFVPLNKREDTENTATTTANNIATRNVTFNSQHNDFSSYLHNPQSNQRWRVSLNETQLKSISSKQQDCNLPVHSSGAAPDSPSSSSSSAVLNMNNHSTFSSMFNLPQGESCYSSFMNHDDQHLVNSSWCAPSVNQSHGMNVTGMTILHSSSNPHHNLYHNNGFNPNTAGSTYGGVSAFHSAPLVIAPPSIQTDTTMLMGRLLDNDENDEEIRSRHNQEHESAVAVSKLLEDHSEGGHRESSSSSFQHHVLPSTPLDLADATPSSLTSSAISGRVRRRSITLAAPTAAAAAAAAAAALNDHSMCPCDQNVAYQGHINSFDPQHKESVMYSHIHSTSSVSNNLNIYLPSLNNQFSSSIYGMMDQLPPSTHTHVVTAHRNPTFSHTTNVSSSSSHIVNQNHVPGVIHPLNNSSAPMDLFIETPLHAHHCPYLLLNEDDSEHTGVAGDLKSSDVKSDPSQSPSASSHSPLLTHPGVPLTNDGVNCSSRRQSSTRLVGGLAGQIQQLQQQHISVGANEQLLQSLQSLPEF